MITGIAPRHICKLLSQGGVVELVNSRGIYLNISGKRVLLCDIGYGVVPNGACVANWDALHPQLQLGQVLTGDFQLQAVENDTTVTEPTDLAHIKTLLKTKTTGLAPLAFGRSPNPYCTVAKPLIDGLLTALEKADSADIEKNTAGLLGLGTGLTPSGDDVLSGLLFGLRHSSARPSAACAALTDAIGTLAPQCTNAVSADYLLALCADAPFEKMAKAWRDPVNNAKDLLLIGSNSGSEMLFGLLLAGKIYKKISGENR